jgi:uncharacterized membrane protein (Fun14 family)
MTFNDVIIECTNFFYTYPYIAIAIVVVLGLIAYWRPKQVLRVTLIVLGLAVVCYLLYYIVGATVTGVFQKEQLINNY